MSKTIVYGIKNCDTVKRSRAWLDQHGVAYEFHDFKSAGVPADHLHQWTQDKGWEALVNRKGTTWRTLTDVQKAAVQDAASATALMTSQPSVIKRPVIEWAGGALTVGYDEAAFVASKA